jgi:hypothetical protein
MARPRLGTAPYAALSVRLDPETLPALDQYVAELRQTMLGARVDRGTAIRHLILIGLQERGFLPETPEPPASADEARAQEDDLEDMPLDPTDMTQESAVPAATSAGGDIPPDPPPDLAPEVTPDWSLASTWAQAFAARPLEVTQESPAPAAPAEDARPPRGGKTARPKAAAKPKPKTTRTTKGRR